MVRFSKFSVLATSAALVAVAGCASPRPVPELATAKTLISQAEQSGATQYASADLESARSKVRQADDQAHDNNTVVATRLANEATADAEVAIARTRAIKAEQASHDVNAGTQTLRNESARQGDSAATAIVTVPDGTTSTTSTTTVVTTPAQR
jgi:hypothetical protein